MPELPEVETVRKVLEPRLKGQKIIDITILKKRIIKGDEKFFITSLVGATFSHINRIGKYLLFFFDRDVVLVSHLRMEGKYIEVKQGEELSRFARIVFTLADGRRLCYDDSRQFGTMELSNKASYLQLASLKKLGPEPFVAEANAVYERLRKSSRPIKETLLDQTIMTGLGNIYADEVLFLSQLHPQFPSNLVSLSKVEEIIKHSITVLNQAILAGGSTVRSYSAGNGITGDFQSHLNAYGREYEECYTCGQKMKKIFVGGRGSTYCPHCQINTTRPLCIAITGLIGAGKSTVGKYIASKGYRVIDSDQIVAALYDKSSVTYDLERLLEITLHADGKFDKSLLKSAIINDAKLLKKVESYIHPLVKKEIELEIMYGDDKVLFYEIPLVFSHKIHELFQYIIGVETDKATQDKFLTARGKAVIVSPDQQYIKHRVKLDKIIINNGTLKKLYQEVDKVLRDLNL